MACNPTLSASVVSPAAALIVEGVGMGLDLALDLALDLGPALR
jgi:hypothetical protein